MIKISAPNWSCHVNFPRKVVMWARRVFEFEIRECQMFFHRNTSEICFQRPMSAESVSTIPHTLQIHFKCCKIGVFNGVPFFSPYLHYEHRAHTTHFWYQFYRYSFNIDTYFSHCLCYLSTWCRHVRWRMCTTLACIRDQWEMVKLFNVEPSTELAWLDHPRNAKNSRKLNLHMSCV